MAQRTAYRTNKLFYCQSAPTPVSHEHVDLHVKEAMWMGFQLFKPQKLQEGHMAGCYNSFWRFYAQLEGEASRGPTRNEPSQDHVSRTGNCWGQNQPTWQVIKKRFCILSSRTRLSQGLENPFSTCIVVIQKNHANPGSQQTIKTTLSKQTQPIPCTP